MFWAISSPANYTAPPVNLIERWESSSEKWLSRSLPARVIDQVGLSAKISNAKPVASVLGQSKLQQAATTITEHAYSYNQLLGLDTQRVPLLQALLNPKSLVATAKANYQNFLKPTRELLEAKDGLKRATLANVRTPAEGLLNPESKLGAGVASSIGLGLSVIDVAKKTKKVHAAALENSQGDHLYAAKQACKAMVREGGKNAACWVTGDIAVAMTLAALPIAGPLALIPGIAAGAAASVLTRTALDKVLPTAELTPPDIQHTLQQTFQQTLA